MKWRNTWLLVGFSAVLFAFIFFIERRFAPSGTLPPLEPLYGKYRPTAATSLQLRRGTDFPALTLERTNEIWNYSKPFAYPAASFAVQSFLETLERVVPMTRISPREILSRNQTVADFGFATPPVVITLQRGDEPSKQLRIGSRTPSGDQVYVEVDGQAGLSVVSAELLDKIPRTPHDWRTTALFHLGDEKPDRVEIAHGATGYRLQLDGTNKLWRLDRPSHRADQFQVRQLLDKIQLARVVEFVADPPEADDESFGLQTPEFDVTMGVGTLRRLIQLGRSPTNNPGLVYARLLSHSNVVLVTRGLIEPLSTPYVQLRERQLAPFVPEFIDVVEVNAEENFFLRRDATGWKAGDTQADPAFVMWWLGQLAQLEVTNFVRDVVTDFAPYGLATTNAIGSVVTNTDPGQRRYTLRTAITNGVGVTNVPIARVVFGTNGADGQYYARRLDEDSVYAIRASDYSHMPAAAWQFREHRIWNFTTNQVARITVRQGENIREVIRQTNNEWIPIKGWPEPPNPFALEQVARELGELTAFMWMARGESAREKFGFMPKGQQVTVELMGEKPQFLTIEFGERLSHWQFPYALVMVDGQPAVFEFPWPIWADLQRYFGLGVPQATAGQ